MRRVQQSAHNSHRVLPASRAAGSADQQANQPFLDRFRVLRGVYSPIPLATGHECRRAQETSGLALERVAPAHRGRPGQMWTDAWRAQQISGFTQETSGILEVRHPFLTSNHLD